MSGRAVRPVYVAGPLGFTESGRAWYSSMLLPAIEERGLTPLDPWALGGAFLEASKIRSATKRTAAYAVLNRKAARRNVRLISSSSAVFAVLDGADVDSGTAAEIGYASALRKPVIGWRSDFRTSGDNDAALINLQVQYFVEMRGSVHEDLEEALDRLAVVARSRR